MNKKLKKIVTSLLGDTLKDTKDAAIVVAAGTGSRMGKTKLPKQFLKIDDVPCIIHTLRAFEEAKSIGYVIVVVSKEDIDYTKKLIEKYNIHKVANVVAGGKTRPKSVMAGLMELDQKTDYIAIHDGARPLITPKNIEDVLFEAKRHGAACAGVPAKDTIKIVDDLAKVKETPDRAFLWQAQTPQIFKADIFRAAAYYADKQEKEYTDDTSMLEALGGSIYMVNCGYENIKITTMEDLTIAQALLKARAKKNEL